MDGRASGSATQPLKLYALRRLKALERRDKTVGIHLDELRALLTVLYRLLPD